MAEAERDRVEASARAKLHGVEMPKQLDFTSKKLYHEYSKFKVLTKKVLTCYTGLEEEVLVDKILMWMGPEACVKHSNHPFPEHDGQRIAPLWTFFDGICGKKDGTEGSWNAARMKLKFMKQSQDESVDTFYGRIRDILHQCEYPDAVGPVMEAEALKYGLSNVKILEKVYALPKDATTQVILEAARAEEAAQRHLREVEKVKREHQLDSKATTEEMKKKVFKRQPNGSLCTFCGSSHPPRKCPAYGKKCLHCQKIGHFAKQCKLKESQQEKASAEKKNVRHQSQKSQQKSQRRNPRRKKFNEATVQNSSDSASDFYSDLETEEVSVETVQTSIPDHVFCKKLPKHVKEIFFDDDLGPDTQYAVVRLENKEGACTKLKGKIDSGSQVCLLNFATFQKIFGPEAERMLHASDVRLTGYGGRRFKNHGKFRVDKVHHNRMTGRRVEFFVSDYGSNIFSLRFCKALKILKILCDTPGSCQDCHGDYDVGEVGNTKSEETSSQKDTEDSSLKSGKPYSLKVKNPIPVISTQQVIQDAKDVFTGTGLLKNYQYKIEVDASVQPVVNPPRRIPEKVKAQLKIELDKMEKDGIIERQHKSTPWVSSLVCSPKPNGKLRICLDPKPLNRAIKRPHHYTQTLNEVLPKLRKCKFFGTLDQLWGYWNILVHPDSRHLLTFNTPFGRYSFKRMPFGLKSSQDVFQRAVDDTFGDIPNIHVLIDDILIATETKEEFDIAVNRVLQRCRDSGFRLNPDKARILQEEVPYFGNILTKNGLKPDPKKLAAIKRIVPPTTKQELQSLLGCFNYLGRFIANLSAKTFELRKLMKKSMEFRWTEQHTKILEELKKCVLSAPNLQYFDPQKEITIECDASKKGLGACLLQDGQPVDFASRSLTDAETRYSNIEREMLAVTWAVLHYRQYVYGQTFTVQNDQEPLEPIFKKDLHSIPARLQRMVMRLQGYDMSIVYKKGQEMYVPDCLSRCIPKASPKQPPIFSDVMAAGIFEVNTTTESDVQKIRRETQKDPALSELMKLVQFGWPEQKNQLPDQVVAYWNYRYDLAILDGLLIRGNKIVIPQSMRAHTLKKLHKVHQGVEKSLERAREKFFWPGLTEQVKQMILSCPDCLENQPRQKPMSIIPITTTQPMQVLGIDIFQHGQSHYQCIVDYHTGYPWIKKLNKMDTEQVIKHLKEVCNQFGYPSSIVSDHGTQFMSEQFQQLCRQFNIVHSPATPHSQWQNGRCENAIGKIKHLLEKSKREDLTVDDVLLAVRDTPLTNQIPSPFELMFHRKVKTDLLSIPINLVDSSNSDRAGYRSVKQAEFQNQTRATPTTLQEDQSVMFIRNPSDKKSKWSPGKIKSVDGERSYTIQDKATKVAYQRNRSHIKPVPLEPEEETPPTPPRTQAATPRVQPTTPRAQPAKPRAQPAPPEAQPPPPRAQPPPQGAHQDQQIQPQAQPPPDVPPPEPRTRRIRRPPERYGQWTK